MNSEIKILILLLENKEEKFTIKKISEKLNINYRIAYEKVINLEKEKMIKITITGNSKVSELTYNFNNKIYEAEYNKRIELFRDKNFQVIHNRLAELNFTFIVLIFGSQAKKTSNKHSDIDILTIGGDQKQIKSTLSLLPDKIHLTSITTEEFIHMAKSKEFTVVSEAIKNNIIILGIEEYYRMLKNAG